MFILGLFIIVIMAIGVIRSPKNPNNEIIVSFSESDLDELGESIESLDFYDLEGLSMDESIVLGEENTDIEITELDLNRLGELLEGLEFHDLGVLTEE